MEFEIFASAFSLVPQDAENQPMVVLQEYKYLFEQRLQKLELKYRNILSKIEQCTTVAEKAEAIKKSKLRLGA